MREDNGESVSSESVSAGVVCGGCAEDMLCRECVAGLSCAPAEVMRFIL